MLDKMETQDKRLEKLTSSSNTAGKRSFLVFNL